MTKNRHYGVWPISTDWTPAPAVELEHIVFDSLRFGGVNVSNLRVAEELLSATQQIPVATGIVNIWHPDHEVIASSFNWLGVRFPGRFTLGLGAAHREGVDQYVTPYTALNEYLDAFDAADGPADRRVLAPPGDQMIKLAASRARGAHPCLATPDHTAHARGLLGATPPLVPEQKVVVHSESRSARSARDRWWTSRNCTSRTTGRTCGGWVTPMPTPTNGGSDRLVDDLVVHGDLDPVAIQRSLGLDPRRSPRTASSLMRWTPNAASRNPLRNVVGESGREGRACASE